MDKKLCFIIFSVAGLGSHGIIRLNNKLQDVHKQPSALTAGLKRFIRSVSTVVLGITHVALGQAAPVGAVELSWPAGSLSASVRVLVAAIWTVINSIAVPGHRDALLVFALELILLASVVTYEDREQVDWTSRPDTLPQVWRLLLWKGQHRHKKIWPKIAATNVSNKD